jgi:hypothetical protein
MPKWFLVPIIVVLMGYVVFSLVRGVVAFLQASRDPWIAESSVKARPRLNCGRMK